MYDITSAYLRYVSCPSFSSLCLSRFQFRTDAPQTKNVNILLERGITSNRYLMEWEGAGQIKSPKKHCVFDCESFGLGYTAIRACIHENGVTSMNFIYITPFSWILVLIMKLYVQYPTCMWVLRANGLITWPESWVCKTSKHKPISTFHGGWLVCFTIYSH